MPYPDTASAPDQGALYASGFLVLVAEEQSLIRQADRLLYRLPESLDSYDDARYRVAAAGLAGKQVRQATREALHRGLVTRKSAPPDGLSRMLDQTSRRWGIVRGEELIKYRSGVSFR